MTYEIELYETRNYVHRIKFDVDNEEDGEAIADQLEKAIHDREINDAEDACYFIGEKARVIDFDESDSPDSWEIEVTGSDVTSVEEEDDE